MAEEPFLINPPKRISKRRKNPFYRVIRSGGLHEYGIYAKSVKDLIKRRRKYGFRTDPRSIKRIVDSGELNELNATKKRMEKEGYKYNPIGETLVTVGGNPMTKNPWYGDPGGHRIAALMRWGKLPRGSVKQYRRRGRPKVGSVKVRRRYKKRAVPMMMTGFGLGRRRVALGRRTNIMGNTWFGQSRRHRKAAKKGWRGRRRRRGSVRMSNPLFGHRIYGKRRYKSYRRNPQIGVQKVLSNVIAIQSWGPLAVTGGLSIMTVAILPTMIVPGFIAQPMVGPFVKYGVQLATVFGGGMLVGNFVDNRHSNAWIVSGVAYVGYQLMRDFVFKPFFPQFAVSLGQHEEGQYEDFYAEEQPYQQVGGGTSYGNQVSAYPEEVSAYPEEVSAYPYDGRY